MKFTKAQKISGVFGTLVALGAMAYYGSLPTKLELQTQRCNNAVASAPGTDFNRCMQLVQEVDREVEKAKKELELAQDRVDSLWKGRCRNLSQALCDEWKTTVRNSMDTAVKLMEARQEAIRAKQTALVGAAKGPR